MEHGSANAGPSAYSHHSPEEDDHVEYSSFVAGRSGESRPNMVKKMASNSFSWLAFLFGPLYFAYRRLYKPAFIFAAIDLAFFIVRATGSWNVLAFIANVAVGIVFGFAFYPLLRSRANAAIVDARREAVLSSDVEGDVATRGGTSVKGLLAFLVALVVLRVAIVLLLAFVCPPHRMDADVIRTIQGTYGEGFKIIAVDSGDGRFVETVEGREDPIQWMYRLEDENDLEFVVQQCGSPRNALSTSFEFTTDYPVRLVHDRLGRSAAGAARQYQEIRYELAQQPEDGVLMSPAVATMTVETYEEAQSALAFSLELAREVGVIPQLFTLSYSPSSPLSSGRTIVMSSEDPVVEIRSAGGELLAGIVLGVDYDAAEEAVLAEDLEEAWVSEIPPNYHPPE